MKSTKGYLCFDYVNWEGKRGIRKVKSVRAGGPIEIWYGKTRWHPKEGWLLKAFDIEKKEERNFAVKDIIKFL